MIGNKAFVLVMGLITLGVSTDLYATVLLKGDGHALIDHSLSFPIQRYVATPSGNCIFIGAHPGTAKSGKVNEWAITRITSADSVCSPVCPKEVTINHKEKQENPLYDAGISCLGIVSTSDKVNTVNRAMAVTSDKPSDIFLIDKSFNDSAELLHAADVCQAYGLITPKIIGLTSSLDQAPVVFAAVTNRSGLFDGDGSGIAVLRCAEVVVPEKDEKTGAVITRSGNKKEQPVKKNKEVAPQKNQTKENTAPQEEAKPQKTESQFYQVDALLDGERIIKRASPMGKGSLFIKIGNNLSNIENIVDLHWDNSLRRLYVALQVTAGTHPGDGARALVVGRIDDYGRLLFNAIAPDAAFTNEQGIVGAVGASTQVCAHKVKTMYTSTHLHYVIILGGNGDASTTRHTVYALPLVSRSQDSNEVGCLASKGASHEDIYTQQDIPLFGVRVKSTAVTQPEDMFTAVPIIDNAPAHVGGGALEAAITDIIVSGDTVFAHVVDGKQSGIYSSQALFNERGDIKGWTHWQRATSLHDLSYASSYDSAFGIFTAIATDEQENYTKVIRTLWSEGSTEGMASLQTVLQEHFPRKKGGIQGLFDVPHTIPGVKDIDCMALAGLGQIALLQTAHKHEGNWVSDKSSLAQDLHLHKQGMISESVRARSILISGGVLDELGIITAVEVACGGSNGQQGLLFVGGNRGVAVLINDTIGGWDVHAGLGDHFRGLTAGMRFKKIGNYSLVRKLIYDDSWLYVISDQKVDRIDITKPNFPATTLATLATLPGEQKAGIIFDGIVSEKWALLATSKGLMQVGEQCSIQKAENSAQAGWSLVPVPDACGPVKKLYACSVTGKGQDVARGVGGMIYALNSYQGTRKAQVNRFSVQSVDGDRTVTKKTIAPLRDFHLKDTLSWYIDFAGPCSLFATDGAFTLHAKDRDLTQDPLVRAGIKRTSFPTIPLDITQGSVITSILRSQAYGAWMIAGDMGLRTNE